MHSKSYMPVVLSILNKAKPLSILDVPSGSGWLQPGLNFQCSLDGIDLFDKPPIGYANFIQTDLNDGVPKHLSSYDAIVSCEGIEHIGNPLLFLTSAKQHINKGGVMIITTPNNWHPAAKLKYLLNGFFPSFPPLIGKIKKGSHMHIMPWSYPHLYLYLKIAGFSEITLHNVAEKKPKHIAERWLGVFQKQYCKRKLNNQQLSKEDRLFWSNAISEQSLFGRRLVVSARHY